MERSIMLALADKPPAPPGRLLQHVTDGMHDIENAEKCTH
jgi:hypothetical protein